MRIIGGEWGGRRLHAPKSGVRPTADRVRQTLFDILGAGVSEGTVLDLYAGTGALGLEALSRGASSAIFVEASRSVRLVLERNLQELQAGPRARVIGLPVRRALEVGRSLPTRPTKIRTRPICSPRSVRRAETGWRLTDASSSRRGPTPWSRIVRGDCIASVGIA